MIKILHGMLQSFMKKFSGSAKKGRKGKHQMTNQKRAVIQKIKMVKNLEYQDTCATFLHIAGEEARAIFNAFDFAKVGDEHKIDILKDKFKQYCEPRKNLTFIRHQFFTRSQEPTETIDAFATDLKNKAKHCEFGTLIDSLIRDRIVGGITSDQLRARLLREAELPLLKNIDIYVVRVKQVQTS